MAVRVGRSSDPREVLQLARELKINRATALGLVILWEEFLLEIGDSWTGRVKGYTGEHIATKLGWPGKATALIDALKRCGVLKTQRSVFFHPYWRQSITGQYARDRVELREYERTRKRRQREGVSPGRPGDVPGTLVGRPGDKDGNPDINRVRDTSGTLPPAPPGAGGGKGFARWELIAAMHKRPRDSRRCIQILDALGDEDWEICRWVVEQAAQGGLSTSLKKRVLKLDSYRFLLTEAYLEFLPERRKKLREENRPKTEGLQPTEEARAVMSLSFVLQQLDDPDLPEEKKNSIRQSWISKNPGEKPPWNPGQNGDPSPEGPKPGRN